MKVIPPPPRRKEEILLQARKLFREKGYEGASMRELAEALGIRPASMYSHYASKEDILWEIAQRCADDFFAAVEPFCIQPGSARERLAGMLSAHLDVVIRNMDASAIFFQEWERLTEPRRNGYALRIRDYKSIFAGVVSEGIAAGELAPAPVKLAVETLLATVNWVHRWYRPGGELTLDEIRHYLCQSALATLKCAQPQPVFPR